MGLVVTDGVKTTEKPLDQRRRNKTYKKRWSVVSKLDHLTSCERSNQTEHCWSFVKLLCLFSIPIYDSVTLHHKRQFFFLFWRIETPVVSTKVDSIIKFSCVQKLTEHIYRMSWYSRFMLPYKMYFWLDDCGRGTDLSEQSHLCCIDSTGGLTGGGTKRRGNRSNNHRTLIWEDLCHPLQVVNRTVFSGKY